MRRGTRKMWWAVPCTSRKSLQTESRMNIEEILKAKLTTIKEEEHEDENNGAAAAFLAKHNSRCISGKKGKRIYMKIMMSQFFRPHFSFKDSYLLFTTRFFLHKNLGWSV